MRPEELLKNHYNPRLEKYNETYRILDWESREAQIARFGVLLDNINIEGLSILDVGCGCGDLFGMLNERGLDVKYTGVDILPGMIDKARSVHKGGEFHCGDIFASDEICRCSYDVVFSSGIFNLNLGNNMQFFDTAVPVLKKLASKYLVVNLLDESSPGRDEKYFYFNPDEAARKIKESGIKVKVIRDYLNNDFTLIGEII